MTPPCELLPVVSASRSEVADGGCVLFDVDLAGRAFLQLPDLGTARGVALQRSRAELGLRTREVSARVALLFARSGGDTGYVGIAGESIVPILEIAEARWDPAHTGFALAAGLVDDLWVGFLEDRWGHSDSLVVLEVDRDLMVRADVGSWASWTAPGSVFSATASLTTGEGYQRRERNGGADVTGMIRVRPLADTAPVGLELAAFGRDGSRGIEQARDHRVGAAAILTHRFLEAGADGVLGWGLRGDGLLLPAGASVWVGAPAEAPVVAFGRVDVSTDDRRTPETTQTTFLVAGGPRLPFRSGPRPAALTVGWEGRRWGPAAAPIAGADLLLGADLLFVQLSVRVRGSVPIEVW